MMSRRLAWVAGGIIAIIAVLFIYLHTRKSDDFESLIKTKLTGMVARATDSLYVLSIDNIQIDVLKSTVTANGVQLQVDSSRMKVLDAREMLPDDIYNLKLRKLLITGISAVDLINAEKLSLGKIILDTPDVIITHQKRSYNRKDTGSLYDRIALENESYKVEELRLQNIRLTHNNLGKQSHKSVLENLSAYFYNIELSPETVHDSTRILFAKDASVYLSNYSSFTKDKMYHFTVDSLALTPGNGIMRLQNIRLKPVGTKAEFTSKLPYMKDMFDLSFKEGYLKNIDWWSLIGNDGFYGDSVHLTGGFIKVYDDRRLPASPESKVGNYPHQMLMKIDFPIHVRGIALEDIFVSYEEVNPKVDRSGVIEFNHTSGTLKNVTNIPEVYAKNGDMEVTAHTLFMNAGKLDAVFHFNLPKHESGVFSVNANLGTMDGKKLNDALKFLALVRVDDLTIDHLKMQVDGNNNRAKATVEFAYHDLKISALKQDADDDKLKKRGLLSFIANTFVIKDSSPKRKGDPVSVQHTTYERDPLRSFFNLVWQSIAKGVVLTARGK